MNKHLINNNRLTKVNIFQRRIQNFAKYLRWSLLWKQLTNEFQPLTVLAKSSILDIWQGSEYAYLFLKKQMKSTSPNVAYSSKCQA